MRTIVCTVVSMWIAGGVAIGSVCSADTFDGPAAVVAQLDGSFHYRCVFRKGPGLLHCSSFGWHARSNVTPDGLHVDSFCPEIAEGDSIVILVDGQLIDHDQQGLVSQFVTFCEAPGQSDSTRILPYQPASVRAGSPIEDFALSVVGSNPTHGAVDVEYTVPRAARVSVTIVDLQGRRVARLADATLGPGRYHAVWSGERGAGGTASPGVYFIRYRTPGRDFVRRIAIAR